MGKGKGKGKRFNNKPKTLFADLSDERKEEIRQKHEEKHAEQGREEVGSGFFTGEVVQRGKRYRWIKPANFGKLPMDCKKRSMCKPKANAKSSGSPNPVFQQNVLFVHMSDVEEGVKVNT